MARFHLPKAKCVKRLVPKTRQGKIVATVKRGSTFFLVGCPSGKMRGRGARRMCIGGTKFVEAIKPASRGKCPAGYKRR